MRGCKMTVYERFRAAGVLPVVVIDRAEHALPTALAMLRGGIDVMEITLRTDAALDAIRAIRRDCPEMLVGAGTVITPDQCIDALEAGATFVVSPGLDREVVSLCLERGIPVIPGCVTPTEITAALRMGLHTVKFFPAGAFGGLSMLKSLSAPFPQVRFLPTGGIGMTDLDAYLSHDFVLAVGGSFVCPKAEITAEHFDRITALCAEAHRAARA